MAEQRTSSGSSSRRAKMGDDVVGQFVIGSEIGKGSFAQVYAGKHKVCGPRRPLNSTRWLVHTCSGAAAILGSYGTRLLPPSPQRVVPVVST